MDPHDVEVRFRCLVSTRETISTCFDPYNQSLIDHPSNDQYFSSQNHAATKILDFARNMTGNTHRDKKYLCLRVDLHVACIMSWYDHVLFVPASKSSIECLEKVRIDEEINERLSNNNCLICLEGFEVDEEAVRIACSHLFHRICIVNWLQRKHVCPLCRFQLPINDD
ncbi:uncharacterized protein LOC129316561 [Prosopis cineraria]|uniref:uncharacterized protein LOC129316561 n=1 Tax=Prosopis cineraria TaxID=364024 RepID=UPI002410B40F|nr:uncharacterized protein LOC129316561 [Prosopis cineraria]